MIFAKTVTGPDGNTWRVGRQWVPTKPTLWRPKRGEKQKPERRGWNSGGDLFGGLDSFDEASSSCSP